MATSGWDGPFSAAWGTILVPLSPTALAGPVWKGRANRAEALAITELPAYRSAHSVNVYGDLARFRFHELAVWVLSTDPFIIGLPAGEPVRSWRQFAVMATGMASVAGTVLAAYAQLGIRLDYLLPASFMAAPGGLLMAKLIFPDDPADAGKPDEDVMIKDDSSRHANVIMAAGVGAFDGVKLAVAIGAMLIAFVGLIALFNGLVGWLGGLFGIEGLTLEKMLGVVFGPLMYLLSVPWSEAQVAGAFFGEKLILNEFVAYLHFGQIADTLSPRAEAITTFALCGFANLSSIAIQMGALGSLVPELREFIARYGLRAVAAGSLSNLLSAALAGLLLDV